MESPAPGVLAAVVVRTAVVLLVLVVALRVSGKRHTGEMNVYDLLLVLIVANAVQNAMTRASGEVLVALVSASTLLALGWLVCMVSARWPPLQAKLLGAPTVVVQDGQVLWANLKHEGLTERELYTELRKHGLTAVAAVKLAILEVDGSLSVVPKEHSAGGGEGGNSRER